MTTPEPQLAADTRPAHSVAPVDEGVTGDAALIDAAEADTLPRSFGVFKPVGHVMTDLPTRVQIDARVAALHGAGWPASGVRQFSPRESVAELRAMVDNARPLAGLATRSRS